MIIFFSIFPVNYVVYRMMSRHILYQQVNSMKTLEILDWLKKYRYSLLDLTIRIIRKKTTVLQ